MSNKKHIISERTSNENNSKTSYCGKKLTQFDWAFQDAEHAINSIKSGSYIEVCENCKKEIIKTLQNG